MTTLPSSVEGNLRELKRDFVLQIYLQRGGFWKNVNRARIVQGIRPKIGLPPPQLSPPFSEDDARRLQSWRSSIKIAWEAAVPRRYWRASDWNNFTAACVLYDPPDLNLEEFAEYGGLTPEGIEPPNEERQAGESLRMVAPPIERIDSTGQRADALEEFYQDVIEELGQRYLAPQGVDTQQAIAEIYSETDLLEKLATRMRDIETHPYIVVDADTKDDDVKRAARMIRSIKKTNRGGRPSRDKLIAVRCATLFRDHNTPDPKNGDRKPWTYERLVAEHGLCSPNQACVGQSRAAETLVKPNTEVVQRYP